MLHSTGTVKKPMYNILFYLCLVGVLLQVGLVGVLLQVGVGFPFSEPGQVGVEEAVMIGELTSISVSSLPSCWESSSGLS